MSKIAYGDCACLRHAVGVEANAGELSKLMSEVSGKDIAALVAEGKKKLASLPAAGAAPAAAGGGGAAPAAGGAPAKKEEKKEESEEEVSRCCTYCCLPIHTLNVRF